jgi:low affinity Fe/Cu permease
VAREVRPSQVQEGPGAFDQFADAVSRITSRAWFFVACVGLVVLWVPSILVVGTIDTWQLIINTITTIVTFLLVGLAHNTTSRSDAAIQQKLNALAEAQVLVLTIFGEGRSSACQELRAAFGIEDKEST